MSKLSIKKIQERLAKLGLVNRPQQLEMIKVVHQAFSQKKIACIEAPTGTGKTLAYCLGALMLKKPTEVVVLSTATAALQEQFFTKDLALLEQVVETQLNVVLAKGRRRYVCHARLYENEHQEGFESYQHQLQKLQTRLRKNEWSGEWDHLSERVSSELWQKISTDSAGCVGSRCAYFNDCVFFSNRRKMARADIVVTNHNLLLSDLELGGGVILPDLKNSFYVIDECHHWPEKSLSHFAKQAALIRSLDWINLIAKTLNKIRLHQKINLDLSALDKSIKNWVSALWVVKDFLDSQKNHFSESILRINSAWPELIVQGEILYSESSFISTLMNQVLDPLLLKQEEKNVDKNEVDVINQLVGTLEFIDERLMNMAETWRTFLSKTDQKQAPIAKWFEQVETKDGLDYTLHVSPINVSDSLRALCWSKLDHGAILCSATVTALNSFDDFLRKTGLQNEDLVITSRLDSPFQHKHSVLFIPKMQYEPKGSSTDLHLAELLSLLPKLILPQSGTLVIFTSKRALEWVVENMNGDWCADVLVQDDMNKMDLIKKHQSAIDSGRRSVIFGLASFAEGIDLVGAYCQHVIIQKIPFTVPSDPIAKTRSEWLEFHKKDPFRLISLPEAAIKLTQYVGRLLRHEDDKGVVTILDKRLYTQSYGKILLSGLPSFSVLINEEVDSLRRHPEFKDWYEVI